ncbi:hypothetical protein TEA_018909 [Camellia sinensis var. sinensis]|uniref:Nucleotide-diphospho-sugar transferase domain-containing protein n=1 Tax=Camellia sinensis var. sinensis TaxID=542762 RepID=A0A4S4EF09_CAMSN|nr:hypothetical protein TEA_018909 [Camellia sinensis var. sinensis]
MQSFISQSKPTGATSHIQTRHHLQGHQPVFSASLRLSTALRKIHNGCRRRTACSCAWSARGSTAVSEFTSVSSDRSPWIRGLRSSSRKWSLEVTRSSIAFSLNTPVEFGVWSCNGVVTGLSSAVLVSGLWSVREYPGDAGFISSVAVTVSVSVVAWCSEFDDLRESWFFDSNPNPLSSMRLKPFSAQRALPFHRRPSPATIRRRSLSGKSLFVMLPDFSSAAFLRRSLIVLSFFAAASLSCFVLYKAADSAGLRLPESFDPSFRLRYVSPSVADDSTAMSSTTVSDKYKLERVLKNAAMKDGTVILTTLNEAWAAPNSIIDLFLESFRIGYGTRKLLNYLDADIMWFRDPFPRFYLDADFQIACDQFLGSSYDLENRPNGGFSFVRSNNRSIEFYKFWHSSREAYPGYHDQDVLNIIKYDAFLIDIELKMRFLNTANFGGFCEPSKDLNQVCTMHANCCVGMGNKVHDLKVMLEDWKQYMSLPPSLKRSSISSWRVPQNCSVESIHHSESPQKSVEQAGED